MTCTSASLDHLQESCSEYLCGFTCGLLFSSDPIYLKFFNFEAKIGSLTILSKIVQKGATVESVGFRVSSAAVPGLVHKLLVWHESEDNELKRCLHGMLLELGSFAGLPAATDSEFKPSVSFLFHPKSSKELKQLCTEFFGLGALEPEVVKEPSSNMPQSTQSFMFFVGLNRFQEDYFPVPLAQPWSLCFANNEGTCGRIFKGLAHLKYSICWLDLHKIQYLQLKNLNALHENLGECKVIVPLHQAIQLLFQQQVIIRKG